MSVVDLETKMAVRLICGECRARLGTRGMYAASIRTIRCYCHAVLEVESVAGAMGPTHKDLTEGSEPVASPSPAPTPSASSPPLVETDKRLSITLLNRNSGESQQLVMTCSHGRVNVDWPMSGLFEIKRIRGEWVSSPRPLLKHWKLDEASERLIAQEIDAHRAKRKQRSP